MQRPLRVAPGVDLFPAETPTLPPATHTNSYALGTRDVVLVEPATPYDAERREWLAWASGMRSRGRTLVAIVVTHHHEDHVGGAAFLSRELGVPIWAHAATAARLAGVTPARTLEEGDRIDLAGPSPQRWDVLHTPGHAPGHVCLFEREAGTVVVGDMVASQGTILIAPGDGDMAEYLAQLTRLEALGAAVALPAHGDPVEQPATLFAHYVRHRLAREQKVVDALSGSPGGASPESLLPIVYADTPPAAFGIAALSLAAHLQKLVKEGRVESDGQVYSVVPH